MKKERSFLFALAILACLSLVSASYWEGTAVSSGYGEFPSAGLYGACSSFPRNSLVDVTNLENGKTVRVIITKGVDNPGVFMSLSPEAAEALGIPLGMVARIRASLPQDVVDALVRSDTPGLSSDPDLNPEALVSRERAKTGASPAPQLSYEQSPSPIATPLVATFSPSPASFEDLALAESPRPSPRPSPSSWSLPEASTPPAASLASVDESLRLSPQTERGLDPGMERLPPPLAEQAPASVDARISEGGSPDLYYEGSLVSADIVQDASAGPEAESLKSLQPSVRTSLSYALSEPGLDALPPEATVYELARSDGGTQPRLGETSLVTPGLEGRESPEIASGRLEEPEAGGSTEIAMTLPAASLPEGEDALDLSGGALPEAISAQRPDGRAGSALEVGLASPEMGESTSAAAVVEERLKEPERRAGLASLSLADPGFLLEAGEEAIVEDRLAAARRKASLDIALSEPAIEAEAKESAEVDTRLAAKAADREAVAFTLPDPETSQVSVIEAEDRPPEAIALERESPKAGTAKEVALMEPGLPKADALDERMLADAAPEVETDGLRPAEGSGLPAIAMAEPDIHEESSARDLLTSTVETAIATLPEGPDRVEAAETVETAAAIDIPALTKVDSLDPEGYYVQIGVYRNGPMAMQAAQGLSEAYPLSYQEIIALDRPLYRVFIGPLRKDESGLVLYQVKAKGYRDAFIRPGL